MSKFDSCPCYKPKQIGPSAANDMNEDIIEWSRRREAFIDRNLGISPHAFSDIATLFYCLGVDPEFTYDDDIIWMWGDKRDSDTHGLHIPQYGWCRFSRELLLRLHSTEDVEEFVREIIIEAVSQKISGVNDE